MNVPVRYCVQNRLIPRLLNDIPNQRTESELESDPHLSRFILVFDRKGYSPAFFQEMWRKHRICCMTYHKHPGGDWPETWFEEFEVSMPNGETIAMKLTSPEAVIHGHVFIKAIAQVP